MKWLTIFLALVVSVSASAQTFTILHSFERHNGLEDGIFPYASMTWDAAENLYGTTVGDTYYNAGAVFKWSASGEETVLYIFDNQTYHPDGVAPYGALILDAAGNLYGTTQRGGNNCRLGGCGTVFKLDTSGTETLLYMFTGAADGYYPYAGLIMDSAGNLYGTASSGGLSQCPSGCGTLFRLDTNGDFTVLHNFTHPEGSHPPRRSSPRQGWRLLWHHLGWRQVQSWGCVQV
jgi:uncharacterized repeat protein (TIGR03803 family)